jgi:hypothetical protein
METKILKDKIKRFSDLVSTGKLNLNMAKEIIVDMNTWIDSVDKRFSEYEMEKMMDAWEVKRRSETIEILTDLLLLTGNGGLLTILSFADRDKVKKGIEFLFKNKDRKNCKDIYKIASILEMAESDGIKIETIPQFREYVGRV